MMNKIHQNYHETYFKGVNESRITPGSIKLCMKTAEIVNIFKTATLKAKLTKFAACKYLPKD